MHKFNNAHATALYVRFAAIYDHKFVKNYHDADFKVMWAHEWCRGLEHIDINNIKDALNYCRKNLEWPPSIAEFIKICESYAGVPSIDDCISGCMRRDFNHPLPLMCYQKIGSWALTHDTQAALESKFKASYAEALIKFRDEREKSWKQLECFNAKPKELPPPPKIPTQQEMKSFKERLAEYQQKLEDAKLLHGGTPYKEFPENKIKVGHKEFDQAIYNEWRDYLISIPEEQTMILPTKYLYERNRFLNMRNQKAELEKAGYVPESQRAPSEQPRSGNGKPTRIYKNWHRD